MSNIKGSMTTLGSNWRTKGFERGAVMTQSENAERPVVARQYWLRNVHASWGIHDVDLPESVGDAVWGPSNEQKITGSAAGQPV